MSEKDSTWTLYSCSQNLPAILNDPNRGKQKDFFTRTWGDSFVDTAAVQPSPLLEDVPTSYFVPYCKKLLKRYGRLQEKKLSIKESERPPPDSVTSFFPALLSRETVELLQPQTSPIPRIYFTQNFSISNSETFREVYEVNTESLPSRLIQDKLSHYLDLVEVGLAQQISKKSSAFFSAVSTQDKVAEKVSQAITCVRQIKEELNQVRKDNVESPLRIISLSRKKSNLIQLVQKLQLMGTVHQAQQAIQSLLGNSDYVGALDLISTTQEVLRQELQGLVSFRHLDSQLVEIRNAIEKMLRAELERNLSADLNRPIEHMSSFYDKDRLVSIFLGHLRLGKVSPIVSVLSKEIGTAMTTTCKQTLIEAVSESDSKSDALCANLADLGLIIPQLSSDLWIKMIGDLGKRLVFLLNHIQQLILMFQHYGDAALSEDLTNSQDDSFSNIHSENGSLKEEDPPLVTPELHSNLKSELLGQLEKTTSTADEKFRSILRCRKTSLLPPEFFSSLKIVNSFIEELEKFNKTLPRSEKDKKKTVRFTAASEMKSQTSEYFQSFHERQLQGVNMSLDREKWRVISDERVLKFYPTVELGTIIQKVRERLFSEVSSKESEKIMESTNNGESNKDMASKESKTNGKDESPASKVHTAETFYVILYSMAEYCVLFSATANPEVLLGLVELMRSANVRLAHLVLGAGAVELRAIKSVTVSNLAIVVRGLHLLISALSSVREVLKSELRDKNSALLRHVETVEGEMGRHGEDLERKMLSIVEDVMEEELGRWEARPPVPSSSINNISRGIVKFKEAISPMLTQKQVSNLFLKVDKTFRNKLKERISALGILKDGGPRHGVVTSEMMHYAENLRKLNVLPANVISNAGLTQELWSTKT